MSYDPPDHGISWEEAMRVQDEMRWPTPAERLRIEKIEHELAEENKRLWAEHMAAQADESDEA